MHETYDEAPDQPAALGAVVEVGRGSLPFALVHGDSLVACAAWSLGAAGVTTVDLGTPWADIVEAGEPFVLHDPLCPMTPPGFVADCVRVAVADGVVVVGVEEGGGVASPVVLPAAVLDELDELPSTDFAELVDRLSARFDVRRVVAPAAARRVASADDVRALEAATTPAAGAS